MFVDNENDGGRLRKVRYLFSICICFPQIKGLMVKLENTIYKALEEPVGSGTARVAARVIVEAIKIFAPI